MIDKMAASCETVFIGLILCAAIFCLSVDAKLPNIVFILTDDQDVLLGGQTPMEKTIKLIGEPGVIFKNMYVSSPLCCPSRSSILTGKYVHNHKALNNSITGNCSSTAWQQEEEQHAFPVLLKKQGYTNFFAGKYLNQYGTPPAGGVKHVPPGWDWWNGLVGNSRYYNYTLSVNGTAEKHGDNYTKDYLTDIIHERAMEFLELQKVGGSPFFMMLSTPACHDPFTPAPQYSKKFATNIAPRDGSFNLHAQDKHWLIQQAKTPMASDTIQNIDNIFRNRWRTLLSVDDMVEGIISTLDKSGLLNETYVFFSSDNGYHLGQFSLPWDKRQLYQFDLRVPLMVRGPGIQSGKYNEDAVMNIDLAPTFLHLTGASTPPDMDGLSLVPLLLNTAKNPSSPFRTKFLVEHSGEYLESISGCPQYNGQFMDNCDNYCTCEDSKNNTFSCVIELVLAPHFKYCVMQDSVAFAELYDLVVDPEEIMNLAQSVDPNLLARIKKDLQELLTCSGTSCQIIQQT